MSEEKVTTALWVEVQSGLKGVAASWWEEHRGPIVGMAKDEALDVFRALREGRPDDARLAVIASMSREEWRAYRDGTTAQLRGVAVRRAKMLDALEELGRRIAEIVGKAALAAIEESR